MLMNTRFATIKHLSSTFLFLKSITIAFTAMIFWLLALPANGQTFTSESHLATYTACRIEVVDVHLVSNADVDGQQYTGLVIYTRKIPIGDLTSLSVGASGKLREVWATCKNEANCVSIDTEYPGLNKRASKTQAFGAYVIPESSIKSLSAHKTAVAAFKGKSCANKHMEEDQAMRSRSRQQEDSGDFRLIGDSYTAKGEKREIWGSCNNGTSFSGHKWNFHNYWTVGAKTTVQDVGLTMDGAVRKACRGH